MWSKPRRGEVKPAETEGAPAMECPECAAELVVDGGCPLCPACGYSRCGL